MTNELLVEMICPELVDCLINIQGIALTKPQTIKVYHKLVIFRKKAMKIAEDSTGNLLTTHACCCSSKHRSQIPSWRLDYRVLLVSLTLTD